MKDSRNEKLSEHLLNVDENILDNAYKVDDAEKLKQYMKEKNARTKPVFGRAAVLKRITAIAACFVLVFGAVFSVGAFLGLNIKSPGSDSGNEGVPTEYAPPWDYDLDECINIGSIDMLNYFTAMKVLDAESPTPVKAANGGMVYTASVKNSEKSYGVSLLSDTNDTVAADRDVFPDDTITVYTDVPPTDYIPEPPKNGEGKVIYYELDPSEVFSVSKVIFFQIEVKNKDGFLASKVGTGTVDVVITENSLEPMITFKNGDRYYSCCENSNLDNGKLYSTHKYIDGFYLVKNLEQENYSFSVLYDDYKKPAKNEIAKSVICNSYKNGGSSPDGELVVVSRTYISRDSVDMTIAELEEYFNTGKLPENNENEEITPIIPPDTYIITAEVFSNDSYFFSLQSNGTFVYYDMKLSDESYRKGIYTRREDGVELTFFVEGKVVETVICPLTKNDGFIYNGSEYKKTILETGATV